MTNQEAIDIINRAIAEVEWEYPMEIAAALYKAIDALEAQEPIAPIKHLSTGQICGECRKVLLRKYKYCPACGKAVKWE